MKRIAFFDFDGTITKKDSMVDFIQFAVGKFTYYKGLLILSPSLLAYTLKMISNHKAKEKLITHFFKDWENNTFESVAKTYALEKIDLIARKAAIEKIQWHQAQGHTVVIVSASISSWIKMWADKYKIDLISTELEIKNNHLTGRFSTKNCYGIEKVNRIKEIYTLSNYNYIYAYGDSKGDRELLSLANEAFYKPFHT